MARKRSPEEIRAIKAKIEKLKGASGGVKAYDVKMRMMARMLEPEEVTLKNGRIALRGKSEKSGNPIMRIVG